MKNFLPDASVLAMVIVLSLLNNDNLHDHLHSDLLFEPEIQDIIQDQSAMLTISRTPGPRHVYNTSMHFKALNADSIFSEINSLGYQHRFQFLNNLNTSIPAYLVDAPGTGLLFSTTNSINDSDTVSNDDASDTVAESTSSDEVSSPLPSEPDVQLINNEPKFSDFSPLSPDLSDEDVQLIEGLWNIDMDLGVSKAHFDPALRAELEKEREVEIRKERACHPSFKQQDEIAQRKLQNITDVLNFTVDKESGEYVPVLHPETQLSSQPAMLDPLGLELQHIEKVIERVRQQHEQESVVEQPVPVQQPTEYANLLSSSETGEADLQSVGGVSLQLQDLSQLLEMSEAAAITDPLPSTLQEASGSPFFDTQEVGTGFNDTAVSASAVTYANNSAEQFLPGSDSFYGNSSFRIPPSTINSTDLFDALGMLNVSSPLYANASLAPSESQREQFCPDELLEELQPTNMLDDLLEQEMETQPAPTSDLYSLLPDESLLPAVDTASDSGLGTPSPSGGWSPNNLQGADGWSPRGGSTGPYSSFDGIEGATGGESTKGIKPEQPYYSSGGAGLLYDDGMFTTNYSRGENVSVAMETAPTHVTHNHTYPAQPGHVPRDLRSQPALDRDKVPRSSRDQKRIRALDIPFSLEDIVSSPVEQFNKLLQQQPLTELQLQTVRDIRRRGKNKVAAQNCRKRKLDVIVTLEDEVVDMREERQSLATEQQQLSEEQKLMKQRFQKLYDQVFQAFRDPSGTAYDPSRYSLHLSADGDVFVVPGNGSQPLRLPDEEEGRSVKGARRPHGRRH